MPLDQKLAFAAFMVPLTIGCLIWAVGCLRAIYTYFFRWLGTLHPICLILLISLNIGCILTPLLLNNWQSVTHYIMVPIFIALIFIGHVVALGIGGMLHSVTLVQDWLPRFTRLSLWTRIALLALPVDILTLYFLRD